MKMTTLEDGTPFVDPKKVRIEIAHTGPYLIYGGIPIYKKTIIPDDEGSSWTLQTGSVNYAKSTPVVALCRCGHTKTPPYCDGSHLKANWDPTLTAPRTAPLDSAEILQGPSLTLTDAERYCSFARFCDAKGRTWNQIERSADPEQRALAIRTANACPAGRLKVWDNATDTGLEKIVPLEIGLIEDPAINVSGPIYATGGIPVIDTETNFTYQPRNRITLCRCGNSNNKPFCDGTHASFLYNDHLH